MTIVLDSGAIIARERNNPLFTAILAAARKHRDMIVVPASVVAQTWRGPSMQPSMVVTSDQSDIAHLLDSANISHTLFGSHKQHAAVVIFPI